jgi:hypothetical protein
VCRESLEEYVRTRMLALGAGFLLALSGCSATDASADQTMPPVQVVRPAAASAGGACILWDYAEIEQQLGVRFDVAAAGQVDDTSTCVVQAAAGTRPDLMLSVVEQTSADAEVYNANLVPATATRVKGLGRAAYRLVTAAGAADGPVVEVGWLTKDRQLMTLRFTCAEGATVAEADGMADRLIALAKDMAADDA